MTTSATPSPPPTGPRPPTAVDACAEAHFERWLALHPDEATILGRSGAETEYADFSPAGREAVAVLNRETLAALDGLEPVDAVDAVTVHAMRERLGLELDLHATGRTELNNLASVPQEVRMVPELMPQSTARDFGRIAGRLHRLPGALEGWWESLRASRAAGHVPAARQIRAVIDQCRSYAASDGALSTFVDAARRAGLDETDVAGVRGGVGAAAAGYQQLASRLTEDLLPAAPETDAVGIEHYRLASQVFTGTVLDLEETYQWGLEELESVVRRQRQVARRISPGADVAEARRILDADPARRLEGTEALQAWMQRLSDEAVAALAGTHFDIPAPMDVLECLIAPTQDGGVYYTGPSDDFSRPGRMWWSVPPEDTSFTTWAETTTVYHEGVPGHHLQIGTATLIKDRLNSWRRHGCQVSGFAEGWALYAEQLMEELGFLADPGDELGMLDMQRMRAARVVFDIGVHCGFTAPATYGGGVWTPAQGRELLRDHLPISEPQQEFEFVRYLGWPGQAPSYKVGQRTFQQLRDQRRAADGADFDLRAFHTELLQLGMVGLDTLRMAVGPGDGAAPGAR